jgi:hypothetical protein
VAAADLQCAAKGLKGLRIDALFGGLGAIPTPYKKAFPAGTAVRVADGEFLDDFLATWKYHHKLQSEQLAYADRVTNVEGVKESKSQLLPRR